MLGHWVLLNYLKRHPEAREDSLAMLSSAVSSRMLEQVGGGRWVVGGWVGGWSIFG